MDSCRSKFFVICYDANKVLMIEHNKHKEDRFSVMRSDFDAAEKFHRLSCLKGNLNIFVNNILICFNKALYALKKQKCTQADCIYHSFVHVPPIPEDCEILDLYLKIFY